MMFGNGYNGIGNCLGFGNGLMYGGWGMIIMAGFIVLAIIGFIFLAKKTNHRQSNNAALEALKIRLAKGEISDDEYLIRKNILD